jgi:hypothetical protein
MKFQPSQRIEHKDKVARLRRAAALATLGLMTASANAADTNFQFKAELGLKETFDSNVYIQDNAPTPAHVAAAEAAGLKPVEANKGSFVTSILPKVGLDYKPCSAFNVSLGYAPDIVFYHSAHTEDYVTHRGTFNLGGKIGDATWDLANTAAYIDGSKEGPTFARPDDIPAIGGIPLRDRRAAFVFRNGFRFTEPVGDWFFRPVASSYIHDFKTEQRFVPPAIRTALYSYENYIDRQDINGGLDIGRKVANATYLVAGYRYGRQDQFKAPSTTTGAIVSSPYGNAYHRILLGVEGSPASWLKLAVLGGPDLRQFDPGTPAGFHRTEMLYYWDASVTVLPSKNDTVTLKSTRYEQPAFSSFSMYEDIKTDLAWRHKFSDQFTATVGFTLYIGDWQAPVNRDDWIYTPNATLTYAFDKHLSAELAYSYDWVESKIPASLEPLTKSHEFSRHLVSLGVKYAF